MSENDEFKQAIEEIRNHFFVPPALSTAFSRLDNLIEDLSPEYQGLGRAFRYNLASMVSSVAMPFSLASASVHQGYFDRIYLSQKFLARARSVELAQEPDEIQENEEAYRKAGPLLEKMGASEEGKNKILIGIRDFLISSLEVAELKGAAMQLIHQGMVLTWSAVEILFRDAFELELNLNPSKAALLAQNVSTRKRFEVEKFGLESLMKYGFDLSDKVGTLLVSRQDFSDLPTIKSVSSVLFPHSPELTNCLNSPNLWLLYQRRHLFVHRRGIVDQNYLDNTADNAALGLLLEVSPKDFDEHFNCGLETGEALLRCLK